VLLVWRYSITFAMLQDLPELLYQTRAHKVHWGVSSPVHRVAKRRGHVVDTCFSIVIVCLNAQSFIAEAIDSVLAQDSDEYELVIVDGGSSDGTLDVVRGFEARLGDRLRLSSEPDDGLYDAMNKGLRMARGRYIVYLGADDRMAPGALAAVDKALDASRSRGIVCGATTVVGRHGRWLEQPRSYAGDRVPKKAPARHQSIFVAREALQAARGFDTRYTIAADYDLYLRLIEAGATEVLIDDVLSEFRLGGVSSTAVMRTAREYRDVRVAHGSNAALEMARMWKAVAGVWLTRAWRTRGGGAS